MNKFDVKNSKTLKLINVLKHNILYEGNNDYLKIVEQMENYIKSKGAQPIGPLIQYTSIEVTELCEPKFSVKLMRQASKLIHDVEAIYTMESNFRVPNCLYVRFIGEESKLKFAYDKLNLYAYEEDIKLKGDCYTVFVDQNEDTLVADIFMEKEVDE